LFVNGALATTGQHTSTNGATGSLVLGRYKNGGNGSNPFKGAVADVAVYPYATNPGSTTGPIMSGVSTPSANKCIDDANSGTADGNVVQLFDCNGSAAQNWTAQPDGSVQALGKCLDVVSGGTAPGTKVDLYTCNGTGSQKWVPRADGSWLNPQANLCLDDPGATTNNSTQLQIYTCNGSVAQNWTPKPLTT
jgi:hypothetical protein